MIPVAWPLLRGHVCPVMNLVEDRLSCRLSIEYLEVTVVVDISIICIRMMLMPFASVLTMSLYLVPNVAAGNGISSGGMAPQVIIISMVGMATRPDFLPTFGSPSRPCHVPVLSTLHVKG